MDISPKNFIFLKTFDAEFLYNEVWFTDQNSKPLDIEDKINITLVWWFMKAKLFLQKILIFKVNFIFAFNLKSKLI